MTHVHRGWVCSEEKCAYALDAIELYPAPNHNATLLAAYRLQNQRIAQRLRFAGTGERDLGNGDAAELMTECADDLERELTLDEAAKMLHLGDTP